MWTIAGFKSECMHFWISVHISLLIQHCMCSRPAFSFFFLCDADTKHQREAFEYVLHLMNGSLEVPRLHLCHHIGDVSLWVGC